MHSCDSSQSLMDVSEAQQKLLEQARPVVETDTLSLLEAQSRVISADIRSAIQVPGYDNSAMDGYAFRIEDLNYNNKLPVSARIPAGVSPEPLKPGTAARIFTGAPVPAGADTVVMQENTRREKNQVVINNAPEKGANIRPAGNDVSIGDTIATQGQIITPALSGLLAGCGFGTIDVFRQLKVAIFSTGDEIVEPGEVIKPGQIYNSNRYTLSALLNQLGCEIIDLGRVEDNLEATKQAMKKASQQADLVMTTGGVSVGEEDHVRNALESEGHVDAWKVKLKPGKPLLLGHLGTTPFLGLPGNPVAVWVTFMMFAAPFIRRLQGAELHKVYYQKVISDFSAKSKGRQEMLRVQLVQKDSTLCAIQYPRQGSDVLSGAAWSHGLMCLLPDQSIQKGDSIAFASYHLFLQGIPELL
ncbi:MAG: molybdopterin molybdotransferase MoeA [bacterium]